MRFIRRVLLGALALAIGLVGVAVPAGAVDVHDWTVKANNTWRSTSTGGMADSAYPNWCPETNDLRISRRFEYKASSNGVKIRKVRIKNANYGGPRFDAQVEVNGRYVVGRPGDSGAWDFGVWKVLSNAVKETVATFYDPWSVTTSGKKMAAFMVTINSTTGGTGCSGNFLLRFTKD